MHQAIEIDPLAVDLDLHYTVQETVLHQETFRTGDLGRERDHHHLGLELPHEPEHLPDQDLQGDSHQEGMTIGGTDLDHRGEMILIEIQGEFMSESSGTLLIVPDVDRDHHTIETVLQRVLDHQSEDRHQQDLEVVDGDHVQEPLQDETIGLQVVQPL